MTWSTTPTRKHIECTPLDTRGPKRLWDAPAGFVIRERGDVDGLVTHDYLCPVHGRFEARVPRRDVPDEVLCPWGLRGADPLALPPEDNETRTMKRQCAEPSPWSPPAVGIWASSGEVKS